MMNSNRVENLARILVDYSIRVQPGERVLIDATTAAAPLVRAVYALILERGGYPYTLLSLPEQEEIFFRYAQDAHLDHVPAFHQLAYEQFESRIRIGSATNPRALTNVEAGRKQRRQKALAPLLELQMRRSAEGTFKWVSTLFPTEGYAMEAEMSLLEFEDFVYRACHADDADPVAYWRSVATVQDGYIARLAGHDEIIVRGPNADLRLSVKGRTFINGCGDHNMPDGELFTGPVEDSVNGWVRFTYPAIYGGTMVEGVELTFEKGRVVKASATKNQDFLLAMLDSDSGARYVGEFAIGTNAEINRFSHNILFDEKIGGTFHLALGAGYPETGSKNKSVIHWDMICGIEQDSEIRVDGEVVYRNGKFVE